MKNSLLSTLLTSTFFAALASAPVQADKPEWAGQGKPSYDQKKMHKSQMQDKRGPRYDEHEYKDKDDKQKLNKQEDHEDRYENRDEQSHEKRNRDRDLQRDEDLNPVGSDKPTQPNEDKRGFQQKMKDFMGWK